MVSGVILRRQNLCKRGKLSCGKSQSWTDGPLGYCMIESSFDIYPVEFEWR